MTTGNIAFGTGTCNSGPYYQRQWSGSDGRFNSDGSTRWNAYTLVTRNNISIPGIVTSNGVTKPYQCNNAGCWVICGNPTSIPWLGNDTLRLYGKLAEAIKDHSFNAAVFAAQGNQLVSQALGTSTAMYRSLKCLKRGNLSCALYYLGLSPGQRKRQVMRRKLDGGDISGTWLAMQYGWLPSLSDMYEASRAFEALTAPPREEVYKASVSKRIFEESSTSPSNYLCDRVRTRSMKISYRLREQLSTPRSLGLYDPASVAWEILPWSFVLDWFIPIGTYLESLAVVPYLNGNWMLTTFDSYLSVGPTLVKPLPSAFGLCGGPGKNSRGEKSIVRTVGTSPLYVPKPDIDLGAAYSGKRLLNALSLFHQQLRKIRPVN